MSGERRSSRPRPRAAARRRSCAGPASRSPARRQRRSRKPVSTGRCTTRRASPARCRLSEPVAQFIARTLGPPPGEATHWTSRHDGVGGQHRAKDLARSRSRPAPAAGLQAQPRSRIRGVVDRGGLGRGRRGRVDRAGSRAPPLTLWPANSSPGWVSNRKPMPKKTAIVMAATIPCKTRERKYRTTG